MNHGAVIVNDQRTKQLTVYQTKRQKTDCNVHYNKRQVNRGVVELDWGGQKGVKFKIKLYQHGA